MDGNVSSSHPEPAKVVRLVFQVFREEATMKKALLIAVAVMFVASSAFALPAKGLIGLFTDATHFVGDPNDYSNAGNTVCPNVYGTFPCWIWCLPSYNGLQAAEFAVYFPPTVITLATIKNPGITVELGSLAGGISVAFGEGMCQMDWVWLYQLTLMAIGPITMTKVDIIEHPGTLPVPAYQFASCLPGYPIEPFIYWSPLYICWVMDGIEQTNWGAIKSLF